MPTSAMIPFNRDNQAKWYAHRHFEFDTGVERILYLPQNAPPHEIRFLEVNTMIPETTPEPIDFGVDVGTINGHKLVVFDVTPDQWEAIECGDLSLPPGWSLENYQMLAQRILVVDE